MGSIMNIIKQYIKQREEEGIEHFHIFNAKVAICANLAKDIDEYGACHIVVDDYNIEDMHIDFCFEEKSITEDDKGFLNNFKELNEDERFTALQLSRGLIKWGELE